MGLLNLLTLFVVTLAAYRLVNADFQCPPDVPSDYYPDPANCSAYYVCVGTTAFHLPCPAGLFFNGVTKQCDYSYNVYCPLFTTKKISQNVTTAHPTPTTTTPTTTTTVPPVPSLFICPQHPVSLANLFSDPFDCYHFYQCYQMVPYRKVCPGGLYYNAVTGQCDYQCVVRKTAFRAARLSPTSAGVVSYNSVTVNIGNAFNVSVSRFVAPADGYYWFHLSVGILNIFTANYAMVGGNTTLNVIRSTINIGVNNKSLDMTSRDDLMWLRKGQVLQVYSSSDVYSDALAQTTWIGMQLDSIISPFIAFAVNGAGSTSLSSGVYQLMSFQNVFVDTIGAWNYSQNTFVAPRSGLYFISFSATASYGLTQNIIISLFVNNKNTALQNYPSIWFGNIRVVNQETLSTALLITLQKGDRVGLYLSGLATYQASLSGFFYNGVNGLNNTAWFVVTNNSYIGVQNPLPFNTVLVNQGNGWQRSQQKFVAPFAGLYYVYLTGYHLETNYQLRVLLNGNTVVTLQQEFGNGYPTRSSATLVRLNQYDKLSVVQPAGYTSNTVAFSGFRLFA